AWRRLSPAPRSARARPPGGDRRGAPSPRARAGIRPSRGGELELAPRLLQDVTEDRGDLVELRLPRHQWRRQLDDRIAAVVGAADQPALVQARRQEAAQQPVALLLGEGLLGLLVLHELERVEEAGAAQVA